MYNQLTEVPQSLNQYLLSNPAYVEAVRNSVDALVIVIIGLFVSAIIVAGTLTMMESYIKKALDEIKDWLSIVSFLFNKVVNRK